MPTDLYRSLKVDVVKFLNHCTLYCKIYYQLVDNAEVSIFSKFYMCLLHSYRTNKTGKFPLSAVLLFPSSSLELFFFLSDRNFKFKIY